MNPSRFLPRRLRVPGLLALSAAAIAGWAAMATVAGSMSTPVPEDRRRATPAALPDPAWRRRQGAFTPVPDPAQRQAEVERQQVRVYAEAMWNAIQQFDTGKALPSDKLCFEDDGSLSRTDYTFIANIGAFVWSVLGARELGLIGEEAARQKLLPLLDAIATLQDQAAAAGAPGGMLAWAAKVDGPRIDNGTISSVDNAWLAAGLALIAESSPALKPRAEALLAKMDFATLLNADKGQFYNNYDLGSRAFSGGTYDLMTEGRFISYLAIGEGHVPASQYFRVERWPWWRGQDNPAQFRQYEGVRVYEHTVTYGAHRFLPNWGGSMFETFLPFVLIPETQWAPEAWGRSHPQMAAAHVRYGLDNFGYWGFSPAMIPATRGYTEYGAPPLGIGGYSPLGQDEGARAGAVVTPHAVFLPIELEPTAALANLQKLRQHFPGVYDERYGFRDSVDVGTGTVSQCMLLLDQAMAFGAMTNYLTDGGLRRYLGNRYAARLRPAMAQEVFWYPQ
ncbi:glucoamylase family protein [Stenotrophomonas sp. HITSZ_GD]|uniref:glucoamylase family protein n=1 Tax=Stenotrophomonas sp. HITSZ_GD TaxID=3037248 RepID=UPI00240DC79B|nr:glucoamylase family protein [Stenotrophomonas sp. HITSZ_GD]MDG2526709.1 glucoamylase family protein [Stenotrophomonas sp. HITSZ_GD]